MDAQAEAANEQGQAPPVLSGAAATPTTGDPPNHPKTDPAIDAFANCTYADIQWEALQHQQWWSVTILQPYPFLPSMLSNELQVTVVHTADPLRKWTVTACGLRRGLDQQGFERMRAAAAARGRFVCQQRAGFCSHAGCEAGSKHERTALDGVLLGSAGWPLFEGALCTCVLRTLSLTMPWRHVE